ncbi:hypothetical protein DSUL_20105 [Desulfovibrionales bacterium]
MLVDLVPSGTETQVGHRYRAGQTKHVAADFYYSNAATMALESFHKWP